jgi:hypothetical protein
MTLSIGSVERIRWMAAMAASSLLALVAVLALGSWQPMAIQTDPAVTAPAPSGSSATLDPRIGGIDYSRSSWSTATGSLSAGFARSSWSCSCTGSLVSTTGGVDSSRSSWSRSSWSVHFDSSSITG